MIVKMSSRIDTHITSDNEADNKWLKPWLKSKNKL